MAPRVTENRSVASGTRSSVIGMVMVCVALSGDPAGKVTVPEEPTKSPADDAVPAVALHATVRGLVMPRLSDTVNTASSPSSTSPGGPVMATTARSLSSRSGTPDPPSPSGSCSRG